MKTSKGREMSIFETLEDYANWGKLIKHCDSLEELSELEKKKAKR